VQTLDTGVNPASGTSLAFDGAGNPAVAYGSSAAQLRLARFDGLGWTIEAVDENSGGPSLAINSAGQPAIVYRHFSTATGSGVRLAEWDGSAWSAERIAELGTYLSLAFDPSGAPMVALDSVCLEDLKLATRTGDIRLHRGLVGAFPPGWKAAAMPLTGLNDDESGLFPIDTVAPGGADDDEATAAKLTTYRALWPVDRPARNTLRVAKTATGITIEY